jgi:signal transduction histidine kinase
MRRRIMLLVVGMTTLVVLAFAIPVGIEIRSAVSQRAEHATTEQANTVALYLRTGSATNAQIASYVKTVSASSGRPTSVMCPDGTTIGTLPPGMASEASYGRVPGYGGQQGSNGPSDGDSGGIGLDGAPQAQLRSVPGGQLAQVGVSVGSGLYLVQVFVSNDALHAGEGRWWLLLGLGSLGLVLIGAGASELLTRRLVRPLIRTAETAHQLSVGDVSARAPTSGPREVAEVGVALNRLADRIDELIAEERETVANLSHRLRTPLTALRLDAEALRDPADAERIGNHAGALERMLTAVIHAARRPQREGRMPAADATAVVGERVRFWSALAEDQDRANTIDVPQNPLPVRAAAEDLAAAVDALLENIIAHTPEGTAFAVRLFAVDGGAQLEISDDGPGLPDIEPVRGRSDRGSSGLGLDIARRCAEAGGGSMTMARSASGGALITLLLKSP